jgi:zinc ribbon protein
MILLFPIHWVLQYRPDHPEFALAMMIPWVLCVFISGLMFAKNMKDGFMIGIKLAIGYIVVGILVVTAIGAIMANIPGGQAIFDSLILGLTDLSPTAAVIFSCIEGGLIGGVFGALAGAIRYKPGEEYNPKGKSGKEENTNAFGGQAQPATVYGAPVGQPMYQAPTDQVPRGQPAYQAPVGQPQGIPAKSDFCVNCGAALEPGVQFCTQCGQRS